MRQRACGAIDERKRLLEIGQELLGEEARVAARRSRTRGGDPASR